MIYCRTRDAAFHGDVRRNVLETHRIFVDHFHTSRAGQERRAVAVLPAAVPAFATERIFSVT